MGLAAPEHDPAERGCIVLLVLLGIVWLGVLEIGAMVALSALYPSEAHEEWKDWVVAGAALISTPLVGAAATWVLNLAAERDARFDRLVWPGGVLTAWGWAWLLVFAASRLLP